MIRVPIGNHKQREKTEVRFPDGTLIKQLCLYKNLIAILVCRYIIHRHQT